MRICLSEGLTVPPTPVPRTAINDARVTKFGDPPAAIPNTPAMNRVMLKDQLKERARHLSVHNAKLRYHKPSAPDITSHAPEQCSDEQTNIGCKRQERAIKMKFCYDG